MFSIETLQLAVIALNNEDRITLLQLRWIANTKKENDKTNKKNN